MLYRYGLVSEKGSGSPTTICSSSKRERHVYTSETNTVDIQLIYDRHREDDTNFIIKYSGTWCLCLKGKSQEERNNQSL